MATTAKSEPAVGQVWRDTHVKGQVEILHVGSDHVLVQRETGIGRYPIPDFGHRFQFVEESVL